MRPVPGAPTRCPGARAEKEIISEKCDIWSFGVILWEMLTLEVPFADREAQQITYLVGMGQVQLPTATLPKRFSALLGRCWDITPKNRPSFFVILAELGEDRAGDGTLAAEAQQYLEKKAAWQAELQLEMDAKVTEAKYRVEQAKQQLDDSQKTILAVQQKAEQFEQEKDQLNKQVGVVLGGSA